MELTQEQREIINSTGNIKINAVAGSGKTTTIIEYAKARASNCKILYLAFNKSVKLEATKKFANKGLSNVKVETAHSLAYKNIVFNHQYKVKPQGYKINEISELLGLKGTGEKLTEYVIANHVNKFVNYFCNSEVQKVQDLNYLDVIFDKKAKAFVKLYYTYIEKQSRIFLSKMDKGDIEITHDFYLKKFQLSNPVLHFDYILFDEGQDASPAMLDIFLKQNAVKVIVGDTHQQIYGWRFAVNSLERADFKTFQLSTSFRFSNPIANLAMEVLKLKTQLGKYIPVTISGKGKNEILKTKAVLARTNLGLLLKAIEHITEKKDLKKIYFEGNINSYTYADEGASLYDVLNLYNGKRHLIRDSLIKAMKDLKDLSDYIDKTEDMQLKMMVEIVKKYGNDIPGIIKIIKEKHIENDDKEKADIIFSTVHRCKGMEYDSIELVNDFITLEKLEKIKIENKEGEINPSKLNEEINLLYVAVTRTKNSIYIPESMMPVDFPPSLQIHILHEIKEEEKPETFLPEKFTFSKYISPTSKSYSFEEIRTKYKGAYNPWTSALDDELRKMFRAKTNISEMAKHFGRTSGAIKSRIKRLKL